MAWYDFRTDLARRREETSAAMARTWSSILVSPSGEGSLVAEILATLAAGVVGAGLTMLVVAAVMSKRRQPAPTA